MVILTGGNSWVGLGGTCHVKDWHSIQKEYSACEKENFGFILVCLLETAKTVILGFQKYRHDSYRRNCAMPVNFLPLMGSII